MRYFNGLILVATLFISGPFHYLAKVVGVISCAIWYGFYEGWYRAQQWYKP